mmetsp:Transcript_31344/g.104725  ORF Transcript_31344/g.104725 Transcript_31344/m.104725 type:complete len:274 (+) Transcript_31344:115-936(+)
MTSRQRCSGSEGGEEGPLQSSAGRQQRHGRTGEHAGHAGIGARWVGWACIMNGPASHDSDSGDVGETAARRGGSSHPCGSSHCRPIPRPRCPRDVERHKGTALRPAQARRQGLPQAGRGREHASRRRGVRVQTQAEPHLGQHLCGRAVARVALARDGRNRLRAARRRRRHLHRECALLEEPRGRALARSRREVDRLAAEVAEAARRVHPAEAQPEPDRRALGVGDLLREAAQRQRATHDARVDRPGRGAGAERGERQTPHTTAVKRRGVSHAP